MPIAMKPTHHAPQRRCRGCTGQCDQGRGCAGSAEISREVLARIGRWLAVPAAIAAALAALLEAGAS